MLTLSSLSRSGPRREAARLPWASALLQHSESMPRAAALLLAASRAAASAQRAAALARGSLQESLVSRVWKLSWASGCQQASLALGSSETLHSRAHAHACAQARPSPLARAAAEVPILQGSSTLGLLLGAKVLALLRLLCQRCSLLAPQPRPGAEKTMPGALSCLAVL